MNSVELALDIAAFANILAKTGFEDTLRNQKLFVEMCNEAGFRTVTGKRFTQMSFRRLIDRLPPGTIASMKQSFSWGAIEPADNSLHWDNARSLNVG